MSGPGTGLLAAMRRLDSILAGAVEAAAEAFGPEAASDPYRGLVIGPVEVARLLRRAPGEPVLYTEPWPAEPLSGPVAWLAETFSLNALDVDLLLIAAAPEVDLRYERLFGYLQDDAARRRPTVDLALHLLCADAADRIASRTRLAPEAPLIRHCLLHLDVDPAQPHQPLLARAMRPDGQLLRLLLEEVTLDPRLAPFAHVTAGRRPLSELPLEPETLAALLPAIGRPSPTAPASRLYLDGAPDRGQRAVARSLAFEADRELLVLDLWKAVAGDLSADEVLRTAFREAWFRDAAICVDGLAALGEDSTRPWRVALAAEVARSQVLTVICGCEGWTLTSAGEGPVLGLVPVPFPLPPVSGRRRTWTDAIEAAGLDVEPSVVDGLAARFSLTSRQIREAVASVRTVAAGGSSPRRASELFTAARDQSGRELSGLARKIDHVYRWDDLVLPDDISMQLRELKSRVTQRDRVLDEWGFDRLLALGRGTCALFAGPSGTGKTMAADVVAGELGLDLYAIDLATVVSKYIGETEKNLQRIFDGARGANAVLFFDEADAIFGKRSEVRDAHDRYANLEIAYLLQKMEEYEGVAILATNLRENLDDAFLRRLHFIVEFPVPDEEHRARMWRRFIPAQAPVDDIDYDFLANRFRLSGGSIKNIVVSAAYLASANGGRIGMSHVMRAARREHEKLGRLLSEADMGRYAELFSRVG